MEKIQFNPHRGLQIITGARSVEHRAISTSPISQRVHYVHKIIETKSIR